MSGFYVIAYFGISQLKMCNLELSNCHLLNRDKIDYYNLKDSDQPKFYQPYNRLGGVVGKALDSYSYYYTKLLWFEPA